MSMPEPEESIIELPAPTLALSAVDRAEIDIQIATAKKYPRSVAHFRQEALTMATLDEETAASMFYALPRGKRTIEGPSVRLAEIAGSAWGNLRYGARDVGTEERWVIAQGAAFDLEKNIACTIEVRRRITTSRGDRYDDDMIGVTSNAAKSIALRNAIFKVIPFAYVKAIYDEVKLVAIGKGMSMADRRAKMLDAYLKIGAQPEQVLRVVHRAALDDVTLEDVVTLRGLFTAIKDGETTFEAALRESGAGNGGTVVRPGDLTAESLRGATTTTKNDAPVGAAADERKPEPEAPKPEAPAAGAPAQRDLANF